MAPVVHESFGFHFTHATSFLVKIISQQYYTQNWIFCTSSNVRIKDSNSSNLHTQVLSRHLGDCKNPQKEKKCSKHADIGGCIFHTYAEKEPFHGLRPNFVSL